MAAKVLNMDSYGNEVEEKEAPDTAYCPWYFPEAMCEKASEWLDQKQLGELEYASPDWPKLNRKSKQLVFVYGTLKRNHSNHGYLSNAKYLCNAVTKEKHYTMYTFENKFPVVIGGMHVGKDAQAHIEGELYEVPVGDMKYLDYLEGTPNLFVRARVVLKLLHPYCGPEGTQLLPAWTYVGNPKSFQTQTMKTAHLFERKTTPILPYYTYIKPGTKLKKNEHKDSPK